MQNLRKVFGIIVLVGVGVVAHMSGSQKSAQATESVVFPQATFVADVAAANMPVPEVVMPSPSPAPVGRAIAAVANTVRPAAPAVVPEVPASETAVAVVLTELPSETKSESNVSKKSGLTGRMFIDGGCPVMTIRVDNPEPDPNCAPRPYHGTVTIIRTDVPEYIGEVTSNPQGHFKIELEPGTYYLRDTADYIMRPMISVIPVTVTVVAGEYTDVTVMFDSGIR